MTRTKRSLWSLIGIEKERMVFFLFCFGFLIIIIIIMTRTARILIDKVCEKLGMEKSSKYFQLLEHIKGKEKKVELEANVLQTKKKWPAIFGPSGSDTDKYCHFVVLPRSDCPASVIEVSRRKKTSCCL